MSHNFPKKVFYGILVGILLLFILHLIAFFAAYYGSIHYNDYFFQEFNFDEEKNFPATFSSLLLFGTSAILAIIGFTPLRIRNRKHFWWLLSFLFLFLASDELLRIHEKLGNYLSTIYDTSGIFHYIWIIPYGIAVLVIGALCIKPILELPKRTTRHFITAGLIFLTGAIGMEMITGWLIGHRGLEGAQLIIIPEFFVLYTLEELLEMIGIAYFIHSLPLFRETYRVRTSEQRSV